MWRRIMVPLDGSPLGEQVLPLATSIAQRARAELVLVQVVPWEGDVVLAEPGYLTRMQDLVEARHEAQRYLDSVHARLLPEYLDSEREGESTLMITKKVLSGGVATRIADWALEQRVGLIVMATHGRSGLSLWALGSVADAVRQLSKVPLVLLRPQLADAFPLEATIEIDRILVALDGSTLAERILSPAAQMARLFDAQVILFRAAPVPTAIYHSPGFLKMDLEAGEAMRQEALAYLEQVARRFEQDGLKVRVVLGALQPADSILDAAAKHDAGMIALTTHGRTGMRRMLYGSVSDRVVRTSHLPILLLRSLLEGHEPTGESDDAIWAVP
jgi:nucleotide-binding universal stress UspA family protein